MKRKTTAIVAFTVLMLSQNMHGSFSIKTCFKKNKKTIGIAAAATFFGILGYSNYKLSPKVKMLEEEEIKKLDRRLKEQKEEEKRLDDEIEKLDKKEKELTIKYQRVAQLPID